jgi:hypothetical protein
MHVQAGIEGFGSPTSVYQVRGGNNVRLKTLTLSISLIAAQRAWLTSP